MASAAGVGSACHDQLLSPAVKSLEQWRAREVQVAQLVFITGQASRLGVEQKLVESLYKFFVRVELQPVQPLCYPALEVLRGHVDDHAVAQPLAHWRYQVFMQCSVLLVPDSLAIIGWRQVGVAQNDRYPEPHLLPGRGVGWLGPEP